jgi:hypothetical protein
MSLNEMLKSFSSFMSGEPFSVSIGKYTGNKNLIDVAMEQIDTYIDSTWVEYSDVIPPLCQIYAIKKHEIIMTLVPLFMDSEESKMNAFHNLKELLKQYHAHLAVVITTSWISMTKDLSKHDMIVLNDPDKKHVVMAMFTGISEKIILWEIKNENNKYLLEKMDIMDSTFEGGRINLRNPQSN